MAETSVKGENFSESGVFLLEVPEENFFSVNVDTIKTLMTQGSSGLYLSLNRPYQNLVKMLKDAGVATNKLSFIDAASSQGSVSPKKSAKCVFISQDLDIDELTKAIYQMLAKMKGTQKFLFIDSFITLTLYQPLSESLRFAEFLSHIAKKGDAARIVINVPLGLAHSKVVKNVVLHVNKVVQIDGK
tara:strand:+ start:3866 stop:4426 length:561 start_codon:yes stop_codon:yes gene_type:complete